MGRDGEGWGEMGRDGSLQRHMQRRGEEEGEEEGEGGAELRAMQQHVRRRVPVHSSLFTAVVLKAAALSRAACRARGVLPHHALPISARSRCLSAMRLPHHALPREESD